MFTYSKTNVPYNHISKMYLYLYIHTHTYKEKELWGLLKYPDHPLRRPHPIRTERVEKSRLPWRHNIIIIITVWACECVCLLYTCVLAESHKGKASINLDDISFEFLALRQFGGSKNNIKKTLFSFLYF